MTAAVRYSPLLLSRRRRGYTLVELLITVSIIAIMASMILFALFSAQETAKVHKTRALITKLDGIIRERYESYRTRRVPLGAGFTAKDRLDVLRDLMRLEMPDRWSDVDYNAVAPFGGPVISRPALSLAYRNRVEPFTDQNSNGVFEVSEPFTDDNGNGQRDPSYEHQGAECLYLIVNATLAQAGDSREVFKPDDVADTDGDGFPEFIDAWGQPIRFLRWAPGFISELQQIGRGTATLDDAGPPVTFTMDGTKLSLDPSRYLFGTVAVLDPDGRIIGNRMARITGYQNTGGTATFTCAVVNGIAPFGGPGGEPSDIQVVLMGPDPFDSRGVYPISGDPDTEPQTFALYPLIYSSGSDRCYGIQSDLEVGGSPLSYANHNLNPFISLSDELIGETGDFGPPVVVPGEKYYTPSGWLDNIHNHQLNMR